MIRCWRPGVKTLQATTTTISVVPISMPSRPASCSAISASTTPRATLPRTTTRPRVTTPHIRQVPMWRISIRTTPSTSTNATISIISPSTMMSCRLIIAATSQRAHTSLTTATILPSCAMVILSPCAGISIASPWLSLMIRLVLSAASPVSATCVCSSPTSRSPSSCASVLSTWCVVSGVSISKTS